METNFLLELHVKMVLLENLLTDMKTINYRELFHSLESPLVIVHNKILY